MSDIIDNNEDMAPKDGGFIGNLRIPSQGEGMKIRSMLSVRGNFEEYLKDIKEMEVPSAVTKKMDEELRIEIDKLSNEDALNMWRTATGRKVPDNDDPKYIKSIKNSLWKNFIFTTAIGEDT